MKLTFEKIYAALMLSVFYLFLITCFASMVKIIPDATAEPILIITSFITFAMFMASILRLAYNSAFNKPKIIEPEQGPTEAKVQTN